MSLLGIQVDAERVIAGVYDIEGRLLGRGESGGKLPSAAPGVAEIYMDTVWDRLKQAVGQAVRQANDPVTAMSMAVQSEAAVAVDRDGRVLAPSVLPEDARADAAARDFQEKVSPLEVMRFTGMPATSGSTLVKLLHLKQSQPDIYSQTWKFLGWQDYLVNRLGLGPVTDPSLAGRSQMFDIINRVWADGVLDRAGIDRARLADVKPAGTSLGEISRSASGELGLPPGTKLVVGGYDRAVAALGVGAVAGGHALNATEGAEYFVPALHEPLLDAGMMKNGFACSPHVVRSMYVSVAFNPTGSRLFGWYRDVLGYEEKESAERAHGDVFEIIMAEMDDAPTDLLVLPYFAASGTPYHDPRPLGSLVGLTLGTARGALIRGLLEGLAFEMKLNTTLMSESGVRLNDVHVTGPAARSESWCRLKADVLGIPVHRHADVDAGALGAAMLAGIGTGVYESAAAAVEFCVQAGDPIRPAGPRVDVYAEKFARYRKLYPALREIMK